MFTKLLFTAGLIGLVYLGIRTRLRTPPPAPAPAPATVPSRLPRLAAWALIGLMLLISSVILFFEWREGYRIVDLRVINTNTGSSQSYRAHRGDVEDRRFVTVDGRVVTLADIERLEMGAPDAD
jgi:hypothetical protein